MENFTKGYSQVHMMLDIVVSIVGIVVTVISIMVTIISIRQSSSKDEHQKSNRHTPM